MYSIDHMKMKCCTPLLQEIHKRVMALSFRDCHTKIRHVDAHATLNEGVVVQVMGELSNNMQPMRKFMQTFVLAPEVCSSLLPVIVNVYVEAWSMCFVAAEVDVLFVYPSGYCCKQILRPQRCVSLPRRGFRRFWFWASRRWEKLFFFF